MRRRPGSYNEMSQNAMAPRPAPRSLGSIARSAALQAQITTDKDETILRMETVALKQASSAVEAAVFSRQASVRARWVAQKRLRELKSVLAKSQAKMQKLYASNADDDRPLISAITKTASARRLVELYRSTRTGCQARMAASGARLEMAQRERAEILLRVGCAEAVYEASRTYAQAQRDVGAKISLRERLKIVLRKCRPAPPPSSTRDAYACAVDGAQCALRRAEDAAEGYLKAKLAYARACAPTP